MASLALELSALALYTGGQAASYTAVVLLAISRGLVFVSIAVYWATVAEMMPGQVGAAIDLLLTGGHVGAIIGPTLSPRLAEHYGWPAVFQVRAAFAGTAMRRVGCPSRRVVSIASSCSGSAERDNVTPVYNNKTGVLERLDYDSNKDGESTRIPTWTATGPSVRRLTATATARSIGGSITIATVRSSASADRA